MFSIRDEELTEIAKAHGIEFPKDKKDELLSCIRSRLSLLMPAQAIAFCWHEYLLTKK